MAFVFEKCTIDIDLDKTIEFYKVQDDYNCKCLHCINFVKALKFYDPEIIAFFNSLGIDLFRIARASYITRTQDDKLYYMCNARLVGNIISNNNENYMESFKGKELYFSFSDKKTDFYPYVNNSIESNIEMEFNIILPWVIDEPFVD